MTEHTIQDGTGHASRIQEAKEVFAKNYVKRLAERYPQPNTRQQEQILFCYQYLMENGDTAFEVDQWGKVRPIPARVEALLQGLKKALREQGNSRTKP